MSGAGRGFGLGRGRGLSDTVGRGAGDGVGRGSPGIGSGASEEIVQLQRGDGDGIGRGRGRGQFGFPGASGSSPTTTRETVQEQLASLDIIAQQRGYVEVEERSVSPQVQKHEAGRGTPRSPAFEEPIARGRGMGRGLNVPIRFSGPGGGAVGREIGQEKTPSPVKTPTPEKTPTPTSPPSPPEQESLPSERSPPVLSVTSGSTGSGTPSGSVASKPTEFTRQIVTRRGEKGRKALYATNFIRLEVDSKKGMMEYHVGFSPDIESLNFRKLAIRELTPFLGNVRMFDGATLFLPEELPNQRTEFEVNHPGDPTTVVTCILRFVKKKAVKDCIQFYNILFNRVMEVLSMVQMRRNFYDIRVTHQIPQHKLEIWPGFCVSVDVLEGGLMLCLDSSHKVLRQETAYDIYCHLKNSGAQDWKKKYEEAVLGEVVLTRYNNNSYKVDEILWLLKPTDTFPRKEVPVSFVDYYDQQYNLKIKDLHQPLLMSRVKPKRNDKNQDIRTVVLIPQFCNMTGLTSEHTQNFQIMKDIAQFTRLSPQQRVNATNEWLKRLRESEKATSILSDWGLKIAAAAAQVEGRIMSGPSITFSERMILKEAGPDFSRESGANCYNPIALKSWVVLVSQRDSDLAKRMIDSYKQVSSQLGIRFTQPKVVSMRQTMVSDYSRHLKEITQKADEFQFVVAIFPTQRDDLYGALKKFCLTNIPIPSQVILAKTLRNDKRLRSVMVKVVLQINCKLGGAIWSLNMPMKEKVMTVGIDVNHDPTKRNPSITAMVCTLDNSCTKYYSRVVVQKPHQEMVDALRTTFTDALQVFLKENGTPPDRIIVFRDGVADSQLDTSAKHEVTQFLGAIESECPELKHFTFVVVQKRINERFYMLANGKNDNPTPGTVIDHTVTRRYVYDYFLISQQVRQGAVTPTHYIVLHELGEIKPDLIQKFSYALSFMYFNWPGTIRVPNVCQYAHKLAFLIGQHVKTTPLDDMENLLYYL